MEALCRLVEDVLVGQHARAVHEDTNRAVLLPNRRERLAHGSRVAHVDSHVAYRRSRRAHALEVGADFPLGADAVVDLSRLTG